MKISTKLAILMASITCAFAAPSYAQTTYECNTGFSEETFNIDVTADDSVVYDIEFLSLNNFYAQLTDLPISRSDFNSEVDFQMAALNAILDAYINDLEEDEEEIIDAQVTLWNGYPTLQFTYVDLYFDDVEAVKIVIGDSTVYGIYAYYDIGDEPNYQAVFDSFRIVK
jgi:hypothetical protein